MVGILTDKPFLFYWVTLGGHRVHIDTFRGIPKPAPLNKNWVWTPHMHYISQLCTNNVIPQAPRPREIIILTTGNCTSESSSCLGSSLSESLPPTISIILNVRIPWVCMYTDSLCQRALGGFQGLCQSPGSAGRELARNHINWCISSPTILRDRTIWGKHNQMVEFGVSDFLVEKLLLRVLNDHSFSHHIIYPRGGYSHTWAW